MGWEAIYEKIREYAMDFYDFAMIQGENKFMIVDSRIINARNIPDQVLYFFMGSFIVMVLLAILASDSFRLFHPIQGIKEWKNKISFFTVVIFTAAVFSFHTFYKMLIFLVGRALHAEASIAATDCLGSYMNPISLIIYAFAVSTVTMRKGRIQAMFLGWATFLTPAVLSFSTLTDEHIILYSVAGVFGIVGAFCYKRFSPYLSCFTMYLVYFIAKFFMMYYSEEVLLLTEAQWIGKLGQYMACMQVDAVLCLLLLLILFGYKEITIAKEKLRVKKDLIVVCIITVFMGGTIVFNNVAEVHAVQLKKVETAYDSEEDQEKAAEQSREEEGMDGNDKSNLILFSITAEFANVRVGPGTNYEVLLTVPRGTEFYGTGNEKPANSGRIWYEIYINEAHSETGWASEVVIEKQE